MTTMPELRAELLVNGYIRQLTQSLFSKDIVIPLDIILLCHEFAKKKSCKLIIKFTAQSFQILDTETKQISTIKYNNKQNTNSIMSTGCYIPQLSDTNDAILCLQTSNQCLPMLLPFNPYSLESFTPITCSKPIESRRGGIHFLFCGNKHGIIYEQNGELYQCKLDEIQKGFNKIVMKTGNNWKHNYKKIPNDTSTGIHIFLSMAYSSANQTILAILNWKRYGRRYPLSVDYYKRRECRIFDLNKGKWKKIKNIEMRDNKNLNRHFVQFGAEYCWYPYFCPYDNNIVYAVSDNGAVSKYDMIKNEWKLLVQAGEENGLSRQRFNNNIMNVWMDNEDILCYTDGQKFQCINLNKPNAKWQTLTDLQNMVTSDEDSDDLF